MLSTDDKVELVERAVSAGHRRIEVDELRQPRPGAAARRRRRPLGGADTTRPRRRIPGSCSTSGGWSGRSRRASTRSTRSPWRPTRSACATKARHRAGMRSRPISSREPTRCRGVRHRDGRRGIRLSVRGRGAPRQLGEIRQARRASARTRWRWPTRSGLRSPPQVLTGPLRPRRVPGAGGSAARSPPRHQAYGGRQRGPRWRRAWTTLDASIGGAGGCPFAPSATGNSRPRT